VLYAELAATDIHHLRLPARDHGYFDTGFGDLLDAEAIADVEDLESFATRAKVQPPISQYAVDVQHQQANGSNGFSWHGREGGFF
jgi:hypothetical protein